jgi:spore coat polysaccharide biosynthesis protein SpsF
MKTIAIIQARMNSSRLPGKVLADIDGQPMLTRVVNRVHRSNLLDGLVVAITLDASDDSLAAFCQQRGYDFVRGSQFDVLDRYYQVARKLQIGTVVRITADCPLIDPDLIDQVLQEFLSSDVDFVANRLPPPFRRTFPIGLDIEVCSFAVLERAWKEADQPHQREHVMPFIYEGVKLQILDHRIKEGISGNGFSVRILQNVPDHGDLRWTVDTPEDLELIRLIYKRFNRDDFSWLDLLKLFENEPQLAEKNSMINHKLFTDQDHRMELH